MNKTLITCSSSGIGYFIAKSLKNDFSVVTHGYKNPSDIKCNLYEDFTELLNVSKTCNNIILNLPTATAGSITELTNIPTEEILLYNEFSIKILQNWLKGTPNSFIFIGSHSYLNQYPYRLMSNMFRNAQLSLMQTVCSEVSSRGANINTLSLGRFYTDSLKKSIKLQSWKKNITYDQAKAIMMNEIPIKRFGFEHELIDIIKMLFDNKYITSQNITIDGGLNRK